MKETLSRYRGERRPFSFSTASLASVAGSTGFAYSLRSTDISKLDKRGYRARKSWIAWLNTSASMIEEIFW